MDLTLTGAEHLCNTFNNTCLKKNYYGLILKALLSIVALRSLYEHSILDNVNVKQCTLFWQLDAAGRKVDLLLPPYPQKHDQPSEEQPTTSEKRAYREVKTMLLSYKTRYSESGILYRESVSFLILIYLSVILCKNKQTPMQYWVTPIYFTQWKRFGCYPKVNSKWCFSKTSISSNFCKTRVS